MVGTLPSNSETQDNDRPGGLPWYRLLTGPDDSAFCQRVSEAIALGWRLYGSPAAACRSDDTLLVAQALIWAGQSRAPLLAHCDTVTKTDPDPALDPATWTSSP